MAKFKHYLRFCYCIIYFMCLSVTSCSFRGPSDVMPSFYGQGKFYLFKDAFSILQYFDEHRATYPVEIDTVLKAYHECFFTDDIPRSTGLRRPFVVVEGKNRQLRETYARMLAKKMGGRYLSIPPKCMIHLIHIFKKGSLTRNAFFALTLYPAAFNIRQLLAIGTPVIMNGYWTEQAAYVIDKLYKRTKDLPGTGSWIYDHPRDLMMPDIVFYLRERIMPANFSTISPTWRAKMVNIYSRFKNIPVSLIDTNEGAEKTVSSMYEKMRMTLGENYDFSPAIPYEMAGI